MCVSCTYHLFPSVSAAVLCDLSNLITNVVPETVMKCQEIVKHDDDDDEYQEYYLLVTLACLVFSWATTRKMMMMTKNEMLINMMMRMGRWKRKRNLLPLVLMKQD